jgi:hypothetical protein
MKLRKLVCASFLLAVGSLSCTEAKAATSGAAAASGVAETTDPPATATTATIVDIKRLSETEGIVTFQMEDGRLITTEAPVNITYAHMGETYPASAISIGVTITVTVKMGPVTVTVTIRLGSSAS